MNYYCDECGGKTPYESATPKFCSQCGKNFETASAAISSFPKVAPTPKTKYRTIQPSPWLAQHEQVHLPAIDKLEIEIQKPVRYQTRETIGSIWGTEPVDMRRPNPTKGKRVKKESILQEFAQENSKHTRQDPIEIKG